MRWDPSHESPDVEDRRGEGPGGLGGLGGGRGGLPLGGILLLASRFGWKGILIALLLIGVMTYGGVCTNSSSCLGTGGGYDQGYPGPSTSPGGEPGETRGPEARGPGVSRSPSSGTDTDREARFVGYVLDDVQQAWERKLPGYRPAKLVLFRGSIASACGSASAAVGPFYCQLDRKVYIDLSFYDALRRRFGAPGDFAQAYVIAHEIGHHIQNQAGLLGRGAVDQISLELQADCLAGVWARDAERRGLLEVGDLDEALNAAAQIGDDTIQRRTTGRVQPETWTHGSAAQRSGALRRGYEGGTPASCGLGQGDVTSG